MPNKTRQTEKGLTLIEMMFSFFFMVLILLFALQVLTSAHQLSEESRGRLLALNAARSTLEAIKNTALVNVPAINTAAFVPAELRNGNIAITTNPANLVGVQIATVTVTVTWFGPRNRPMQFQMTTMRSRF